MKVAIYIEDGVTQLVLKPETDFEKGVIGQVEKKKQEVEIYTGSFYQCQGGWIRQYPDNDCLILVMGIKTKE